MIQRIVLFGASGDLTGRLLLPPSARSPSATRSLGG